MQLLVGEGGCVSIIFIKTGRRLVWATGQFTNLCFIESLPLAEELSKHLMSASVLKTITEQDRVHHYHSLPFTDVDTMETSERLRSFSKECWGAGFKSEGSGSVSPTAYAA